MEKFVRKCKITWRKSVQICLRYHFHFFCQFIASIYSNFASRMKYRLCIALTDFNVKLSCKSATLEVCYLPKWMKVLGRQDAHIHKWKSRRSVTENYEYFAPVILLGTMTLFATQNILQRSSTPHNHFGRVLQFGYSIASNISRFIGSLSMSPQDVPWPNLIWCVQKWCSLV